MLQLSKGQLNVSRVRELFGQLSLTRHQVENATLCMDTKKKARALMDRSGRKRVRSETMKEDLFEDCEYVDRDSMKLSFGVETQ